MLEQLMSREPNRFSRLAERFDKTPISHYNGFFSFVYHYPIKILGDGRFDEAARAMQCLFEGKYENLRGCVDPARVDLALKETMYSGAVLGTSYHDMRLDDMQQDEESLSSEILSSGAARLRRALPELEAEIGVLVESILFFQSGGDTNERALSFTANRCQSLIFINGRHDPKWIFLLDKLVHEAAHTYLFAVNLQEELVSNSAGAEFGSPLRNDKRTLIAIYHATFVIERLIFCFSGLAADTGLTTTEAGEIAGLLDFYHSRLDHGYNVVMEHAHLTHCGRRLLDEGREFALDARTRMRLELAH